MDQNFVIIQGKVVMPIEQTFPGGKERLRFKIKTLIEVNGKNLVTETPIILFDNNNFIDKLKENLNIIVEGRLSYHDSDQGHLGYITAYKIHLE